MLPKFRINQIKESLTTNRINWNDYVPMNIKPDEFAGKYEITFLEPPTSPNQPALFTLADAFHFGFLMRHMDRLNRKVMPGDTIYRLDSRYNYFDEPDEMRFDIIDLLDAFDPDKSHITEKVFENDQFFFMFTDDGNRIMKHFEEDYADYAFIVDENNDEDQIPFE